MGRIIIKTINGRKYRYERISTKRVGGKVKTDDKYIGPVKPATGKIEQAPAKVLRNIESLYQIRVPVKDIVERLRKAGIKVGESTVRKYMKRRGIARMGYDSEERSESAKEAWGKKKKRTTDAQREATHHIATLLEDGKIKAKDVAAMSRGGIDEKVVRLLWKKSTKKKRRKKRK